MARIDSSPGVPQPRAALARAELTSAPRL